MRNFIYLEAPNRLDHIKVKDWQRTIFLAGSITGAWNWQNVAKDKLLPYFSIFNPRRENFDVKDPAQERLQIQWEFDYLDYCSIALFYFSHETLGPISLFELGKMLEKTKTAPWRKIYICIHPDYKRKNDVIIQTELVSKEISKRICFSLDEVLELIIKENK